VAVGLELGLPFERVAAGLAEFSGAERRFEVKGEPNGILVVDDYGHHPTEIAAVIAAARTLKRRIVIAFQPHRYSRTAALIDAFGPSLAGADHIVLTDIYGAGEDPLPGVTVEALAAAVRRSTTAPIDVVRKIDDVAAALVHAARPGDVVLTLGAGSIGSVPAKLIELLGAAARGAKA
jgi:UDP-N-acetylmuramate--alanine ligase